MSSVSAIVITLNEEEAVRDCLESIQWVDEIVVVDSGSTDRTVEIARNLASKVIESEWLGYSETKTLALSHATHPWVLWVDADEVMPEQLSGELQQHLNQKPEVHAYYLPRKAIFLGRWIRHCGWYPDYVCRVFMKEHATFNGKLVHEGVSVDGPAIYLQNPLLHYTDRTLEHYLDKFNRYTSLAARQMLDDGRTFRLFDLLLRPPFFFLKMYVLKRGFLDGIQGLILCVLSSTYVFTKYAKFWFLQNRQLRD